MKIGGLEGAPNFVKLLFRDFDEEEMSVCRHLFDELPMTTGRSGRCG